MFKIYFNDSVVELTTTATLESAKEFINNYLKGYTLVDEEHGCTDDVLTSSAVAQLEVYNSEPIKYDEDGEAFPADPVFTSDYLYTR